MEVLASKDCFQLFYDPENGIQLMKPNGDISDDLYKEAWESSMNHVIANSVNRIIIDQRSVGNVGFKARAWVVMHAFPKVKRNYPKSVALAILASNKIMQRTGLEYLLKTFRTVTRFKVQFFSTEEDAKRWLLSANSHVPMP